MEMNTERDRLANEYACEMFKADFTMSREKAQLIEDAFCAGWDSARENESKALEAENQEKHAKLVSVADKLQEARAEVERLRTELDIRRDLEDRNRVLTLEIDGYKAENEKLLEENKTLKKAIDLAWVAFVADGRSDMAAHMRDALTNGGRCTQTKPSCKACAYQGTGHQGDCFFISLNGGTTCSDK